MTKKNKTLIAAVMLLVALAGGYYGAAVFKTEQIEAPIKDFTPPPRLGSLDRSKLVRIEVPSLALEKHGEGWELVSLKDAPLSAGIELDQNAIYGYVYSLASILAESIVEESPADISLYGLVSPFARITITDSSGEKNVYVVGDMNPSRNAFYVMQEGDPRVYLVSSYIMEHLLFTLDSVRVKTLFPPFEFADLTRLRWESSGSNIDIVVKPESLPVHMGLVFSTHIMTSPYALQRSIDPEAFEACIAPLLAGLFVEAFVDDAPASLTPYGLDNPLRISLETTQGSVDFLVGDAAEDMHYAKLANAPGVFLLKGLAPLVDAASFDLVDKFALILNIDDVDTLTVRGGEIALTAEFQGKGDAAVYSLNGKEAESKSFRIWYQSVIGLLADAEYPGLARNPASDSSEKITITYTLNNPAGAVTSITLIPYDRDYYALLQEDTMEFLVSRNQVRKIFEAARAVLFEE